MFENFRLQQQVAKGNQSWDQRPFQKDLHAVSVASRVNRYKVLICVAALFPLLVLAGGCLKTDSKSKKAPQLQADVFYPQNQSRFNLVEKNKEKPVLIVFWASWCESCKEEIPKLNEIVSNYREKIEVVSINAQEEAPDVQSFLSQTQVGFPVLLDPDGKFSALFEVTALPSVLLLAKSER